MKGSRIKNKQTISTQSAVKTTTAPPSLGARRGQQNSINKTVDQTVNTHVLSKKTKTLKGPRHIVQVLWSPHRTRPSSPCHLVCADKYVRMDNLAGAARRPDIDLLPF